MAWLFDTGIFSIEGLAGQILPGATLSWYAAGTSTPLSTYADNDLTVPNLNPIPCDADGRFGPMWMLEASYKFILKDSLGNVLRTRDDVANPAAGALADADALRTDLASTASGKGASLVGAEGGGTVQDKIDGFEGSTGAFEIGYGADTVGEILDNLTGATLTVTVGSGGTFPTLVAALDWAQDQPLTQQTVIDLLSLNTPDSDSGCNAIPDTGYIFRNPNSRNLVIRGPAFGFGQGAPQNSDMTGTRATDLAFIKNRYNASIRLNGANNTTGTYGLAFPHGIGGFDRILFECRNRYNIDLGFNGSHDNATGNSGGIFSNCSWFGGVWGILGVGAAIGLSGSRNFFGYQINGGPIGVFSASSIEIPSANVDCYYPKATSADQPKYVIYLDDSSIITKDSALRAYGYFGNGIYATNNSSALVFSPKFDGVYYAVNASRGSVVDARSMAVTDSNGDNFTLVAGLEQIGIIGNGSSGNIIFSGSGSTVMLADVAVTASKCGRVIGFQGGKILGYLTVTVNDVYSSVATVGGEASHGNVLSVVVTSPRVGSANQVVAGANSSIHFYTQSGMTFSPALNNFTTPGKWITG